MTIGRRGHSATLLPSGKVLVAGGYTVANAIEASTEIYDPATGQWSPGPAMSRQRVGQLAILLPGGRVLVFGGRNLNNTSELFDLDAGTWLPAVAMQFTQS